MASSRSMLESSDAAIRGLLHAVRRHLWWRDSRRAAECALWSSAGLLLAAALVHLLVIPLHLWMAITTIAMVWIASTIWAAVRRPSDSDCALWADRNLGGACAFSTWLEKRIDATASSAAVRSLDAWTRARIPQSLAVLAQRRERGHLLHSIAASSTALLIVVLILAMPGGRAVDPPDRQASTGSAGDRFDLAPKASATADSFAHELSSALRSNGATQRDGKSGTGTTTSEGRESDSPTASANRAVAAIADSKRAAARGYAASSDVTAGQQPGSTAAASGREAGASRDQRTDPGVSPLLRGTMSAQRAEIAETATTREERADMDEPSAFNEGAVTSHPHRESAVAVVPAVMPPTDSMAPAMSSSRAAYVRAWTKALSQTR